MAASTKRKTQAIPKPQDDTARRFLELYYPIHYQAGVGVEDALRGEDLSRHECVILWLIRARGGDGKSMKRKEIERALVSWFEISGAALTKALRRMAQAPLKLVRLEEDPGSAREKVVFLTARGEAHIARMITRGCDYVQRIIDEMSAAEIANGLRFFERIATVVAGSR